MKKLFSIGTTAGLLAVLLVTIAATYQLGSPFPRLADTTGNPIRVGYGLNITNRWLYVTNASGGGTTGTVTSVAMTVPTGFAVSGSPITTAGTLAVTTTGGFSATNLSSGLISNTEFDFLDGVTGGIQTNINARTVANTANYVPYSTGTAFADSPLYLDGSTWRLSASDNLSIIPGPGFPMYFGDAEKWVIEGTSGNLTPSTTTNISLGSETRQIMDVWSGQFRTYGYTDGIGNRSGFTIRHLGTNDYIVLNSLAEGNAGTPRDIALQTNGVRYLGIGSTAIVPGFSNAMDLGSSSFPFKTLHVANGVVPGGAAGGILTNTYPSPALGTNVLTSAQLAAAVTDETGTGVAVFSSNPTFTNSNGLFNYQLGISIPGTASSYIGIHSYLASGVGPVLRFVDYNGQPFVSWNHAVVAQYCMEIRSDMPLAWNSSYPGSGSIDALLIRDSAATIQMGLDAATAIAQTIKAHDGSGTDKAGANLTIGGGQSTGTGTPGRVYFNSSTNGSSSATQMGYGRAVAAGGTLKVDNTSTNNVGAGEDTLTTYSVPACQLAINGDSISFEVAGTFAANANSKQVKIYFGSTVIVTSGASVLLNGQDWRAFGRIFRKDATTQKAVATFMISGALLGSTANSTTDYTAPAETLSGAVTFKATGEGVADSDITQEIMMITWHGNN